MWNGQKYLGQYMTVEMPRNGSELLEIPIHRIEMMWNSLKVFKTVGHTPEVLQNTTKQAKNAKKYPRNESYKKWDDPKWWEQSKTVNNNGSYTRNATDGPEMPRNGWDMKMKWCITIWNNANIAI